jgi:hypothetical protein
MPASLVFKSADFEPVYGWLEGQPDLAVEVWGLENDLRAALLAYNDDPQDGFSWSNWAAAARDDPSELVGLFETLTLVAEPEAAAKVSQAFPGVFSPGPASA